MTNQKQYSGLIPVIGALLLVLGVLTITPQTAQAQCSDARGNPIPCPSGDDSSPRPDNPDNDRDSDGVPDANDWCAYEPGPVESEGCPWGHPYPNDGDGDGVKNDEDACPEQAGEYGNNGCPTNDSGAQGNGTVPISRPMLPEDGDCVLRTASTHEVNARFNPSTAEGEIINHLNPAAQYPILLKVDIEGEMWFLTPFGFVAAWVIDLGGDCDEVTFIPMNNHFSEIDPDVAAQLARNWGSITLQHIALPLSYNSSFRETLDLLLKCRVWTNAHDYFDVFPDVSDPSIYNDTNLVGVVYWYTDGSHALFYDPSSDLWQVVHTVIPFNIGGASFDDIIWSECWFPDGWSP